MCAVDCADGYHGVASVHLLSCLVQDRGQVAGGQALAPPVVVDAEILDEQQVTMVELAAPGTPSLAHGVYNTVPLQAAVSVKETESEVRRRWGVSLCLLLSPLEACSYAQSVGEIANGIRCRVASPMALYLGRRVSWVARGGFDILLGNRGVCRCVFDGWDRVGDPIVGFGRGDLYHLALFAVVVVYIYTL